MRSYLLVLSAAATLVACGDNLQGDQPPTVTGRAITTAEDTATTFTVDASDPENEGLTFTASTPAHGTITVAGASLTYTPDADYHGDDAVTVTVSDGSFSASAAVAITVTPVNDAPVAEDDAVATSEDVPAVIAGTTLVANDTDVDGDTLTVSAVGTASAGTVVLAAGTVTYTPPLDFTGDATFTYTVSDGTASAMATVTVAVGGANDPPVATDDAVTTAEDTAATIPAATLLANDTDAEGQTLTVTAVAGATNGTVALAGTTVTFTPTANFSGAATFTYTVSDGADTDTGTVTVTVTPVNDGPVAVADTATTAEDTVATIPAATLLANDSDVESTPTVTAVSGATNGTVALAGTTVTFTPAANFNGAAGFDYTISDGTLTATARVTVTVTPVNDGPVAVADAVTTAEDTAAVIAAATLLTNDTDVDGPSLTITAVTGATGGTVALAGTTVTFTPTANTSGTGGFDYTISDGTLTSTARVTVTVTPVNDAPVAVADTVTTAEDTVATIAAATLLANDSDPDGTPTITAVSNATSGTVALAGTTITFTPAANFSGAAGFDYTISDGTLTATAHVTVTVTPVNDAPVAVADTVTTAEDTVATIAAATLLANDSDPDGTTPTISAVSNATGGTVSLAGTTITFTPTANFSGAAGFDYTITDGTLTATAHVTVSVTAANDAPVATDDTVTTAEDTVATIAAATLLANDSDPDGTTPTISAVSAATNGTVALAGTTITFTPTADFSGTAGFDYTITDGTLTATAHVTVTVTPVNDGPVAVDDFTSTNQDTPAVIPDASLLANDTDVDGPALTVSAVSNPTNGTVTHVGTTVTFTPTTGFTGTAGFDYTITDGTLTSTAHVTVSVGNVNDAPVAVADAVTTDEDTAAVISGATLTGNDTDPDSDPLFVSAVSNPTNGTVTLVLGVVTFTPTADFFGTAGFDYTVSDGFLTSTAHVTVTVNSIDDLPVAVDDNAFTQEDLGVFIDVLTNDTGLGDGGVSITATTNGAHGSVSTGGTNVLYLPEANYAGTDTFTYTLTDADGDTATATVTVTLGAQNDAPVANGQSVATNAGTPVTITLTATDVDSPSVTFAVGTPPAGGTLGPITPTGAFTATVLYTNNAGFSGSDPFTFTANDGALTSAPATVTVTVTLVAVCGNGVIEAPETCDDNGTVPGDGCSATCTTETGWTCTGAPSACDEICGDTLVVGGEQCDDGPGPDTDGCTSQCITGRICTSAAITGGDAFSTDPATGTCYVSFTAEPTSFGGAYAACGTVGGHLVTITSAAEQARVHSIHLGTPWIGASEDGNDTDAVFDWVTTEAFGFTAFAPGEPDDDAAFGGNGECLAIVAADGAWGDTDCNFVGFTDGRICELPVDPCGDGIIEAPEACDDGNRNGGDGCSATCTVETAFFSEYLEGSGNNKAIEIHNSTAAALACTVGLYVNGSATRSAITSITIPANDEWVICNSTTGSLLIGNTACNQFASGTSGTIVSFNGDDALDLICGTTTVDIIGQIGLDPGTEWGSAPTTTLNATLRRKCTATAGDTIGNNAFVPATNWLGAAIDTFTNLGTYTCP